MARKSTFAVFVFLLALSSASAGEPPAPPPSPPVAPVPGPAPPPALTALPPGVVVLEDFEDDGWSNRWTVTPSRLGDVTGNRPLHGSKGLLLKSPGMATFDLSAAKAPSDWTKFEAFSYGVRNIGSADGVIETQISGVRSASKRDKVPCGGSLQLGFLLGGLQPDMRASIQTITIRAVSPDEGEFILDMFAVRPAGVPDPTLAGASPAGPSSSTGSAPAIPSNPVSPPPAPPDKPAFRTPPTGTREPNPGLGSAPPDTAPGNPPSNPAAKPPDGERAEILSSFEENLDLGVWYGKNVRHEFTSDHATHGARCAKFSIVPGVGYLEIRKFDQLCKGPSTYRSLKFDVFNPNDMEFPIRLQFFRTKHQVPQKGTDIMNVTLFEKVLKPGALTTVEIPMADAWKHESGKPILGCRIDLPFKVPGPPDQALVIFMDYVRFTLP